MTQAIVIYDFKATEATELTVYKNEILEINEKGEDWWKVVNKYGQSGLVPVNFLAAPITDNVKVISRGKTKKGHKARSENELSIEEATQVAVLDKADDYWWFIGYNGETGFIPKHIIHEFKPKDTFEFREIAPKKAICDVETTVLFSFKKPLPDQGEFVVTFKGDHCEKVVDGERLNDFTIRMKSPKYFPPEKTVVTINHLNGQKQQSILKGIDFLFQSKMDLVHKILSTETDPLNFLCSSFQIGDLQNVDHILSGNFDKKVPEGIDLLKSSKSVLVQDQVYPKETPTLLHFAAYYDLKKLARSLLKCPGAKEAMSIKNCHGNGPVGVAQMRKHEDLERILQDHQANKNVDYVHDEEDEYMSMEDCYERYVQMDGGQYVHLDQKKHGLKLDEDEELYEDMDGGKPADPKEIYDTPRSEDRFEPYDDDLDDNANKIDQESEMEKKMEEYKVWGRMTEKEVQLALLMKRVKERYITQEQALEMARVLRLEPQASSSKAPDVTKKRKPRVQKRVSAPEIQGPGVPERKTQSLPRTMSTSSSSSASSVGSTGSAGYGSDRPPAPAMRKPKVSKPPSGAFNYLKSSDTPKQPGTPPPNSPRRVKRTPSDPPPPTPVPRGPRR